MFKQYLIIILVTLFITGCATQQVRTITVEKTTSVFIKPPENLTENCKVGAPPSKKEYMAADASNKEALLTVYARSQITSMNACNSQLTNLRAWINKQLEIYTPTVKE